MDASFVAADIPAGLGGEHAKHVRSTHAGASGWARGEWEAVSRLVFKKHKRSGERHVLLCATGANSRSRPPVISTRPIAPADTPKHPPASLRSSERVVAYPILRYIDPNHSDILHEAHTVYRIERDPHWNLRAGGDSPRGSATANAAIRIPCAPNERPEGGNLTREEPSGDHALCPALACHQPQRRL